MTSALRTAGGLRETSLPFCSLYSILMYSFHIVSTKPGLTSPDLLNLTGPV